MVFLLPNFQSTCQNYCRIIFFSGTLITFNDIWEISSWEKNSFSLPLKSILSSFSSSSSSSTNQHVKLTSPFPKIFQVSPLLFGLLCMVCWMLTSSEVSIALIVTAVSPVKSESGMIEIFHYYHLLPFLSCLVRNYKSFQTSHCHKVRQCHFQLIFISDISMLCIIEYR